jgi:chromosome segregation ATPase
MGSFHARNGPGELLARYSFLEPLLEGRRVLEVGAARSTEGASALFLAERGAAAILSVEPDDASLTAARRTGHHPFVQFQSLEIASLRAGTFDLILLTDGGHLAASPEELATYRRLLAPGGRLVTAIAAGGVGLPDLVGDPATREPPPYEAFVNALADHFPLVEVAAQTATVGWVFGLPSETEPEIAMDGTLAGTPDTTSYVAIAGDEPTGLSGFTVVALPVAPLVEAARGRTDGAAAAKAAEEAEARIAQAEAMRSMSDEALAGERTRVAELTSALAALEVDRDAARHGRDGAVAEAEALRSEREAAIRARDAARADAEAAASERDHAVEGHRLREGEREALLREREVARTREVEAQRSREVALAEAVVLGESLSRAEALATELGRDRDAAAAARDEVMQEAGELRIALDEARLANGALEGQLHQARTELARLAGKVQEVELAAGEAVAGNVSGMARIKELEDALEAEKASAFEVRAALDRTKAATANRDQELEAARAARAAADEERARFESILAEHRTGSLESDAALQAARAEVQAARAALEAALDRATQAENRTSDLEEALERAAAPDPARTAELEDAKESVRKLEAEVARLSPHEEASARLPQLEAEVSRLAAFEEASARLPQLEAEVSRLASFEEASARLPQLEAELARLAPFEHAAARLPALEAELAERNTLGFGVRPSEAEELRAEIARLRGLEEAAIRVPALEAEVARLAGLEHGSPRVIEPESESAAARAAELAGELASALTRVKQLEEIAGQVPAAEEELVALRTELERVRAGEGPRVTEAEAAREKAAEELEELEAQVADLAAAREQADKRLAELKDAADKKVADARRAAYDAAAKAEAARRDAEAARKELATAQAAAQSTGDAAKEFAPVREALEAQVAELQARLEAEEERSGILSAQAAEARAQLESAAHRPPELDGEERLRAAEARAEDLARLAVSAETRARELDAVAALGVPEDVIDLNEGEDALRAEIAELKQGREILEKELAQARNQADTAEASAAEIAAELQAVQWDKDELEQKLQGGAPAPLPADAAKLRDELAERMAELALQKREVERLEAVVASLAIRTEVPEAGDPELQARLTEALQRAADAEAALGAARAGSAGDHAEAMQRAKGERDAIAAQVAERDGKIARLQREVADKTERLGRLAKELGELKAKGLGKIFR